MCDGGVGSGEGRTITLQVPRKTVMYDGQRSFNDVTGTVYVIMNWPERIKTHKTQPHDDRDNCFQHFDSKGPCGMTMNTDIDDDSATKHSDSHTRNAHRQSV